jgi:hypothetical protein
MLRKKIEMLLAHLKRILKLDRLRLREAERRTRRVHTRRSGSEPSQHGRADPHARADARVNPTKPIRPRNSGRSRRNYFRLFHRNRPEADMLRFIRQGSLRDTGDTE